MNLDDDELVPVTPDPATPPVEQDNSVRGNLKAAFEEAKRASAPERPTPREQRRPPQRPAANDGRVRGPDGKFIPVKADGEAPDTAAPAADTEQEIPAGDKPDEASKPAGDAPGGWSREAKAEWAKLSPAVQQAVLKREKEASDGFAKYGDNERKFKEIDAVLAPRRRFYPGQSDAQATNQIWAWFEALQNDPQKAFPALAKSFNFDFSNLAPKPDPTAQAGKADASVEDPYLRGFIDPVLQKVNELSQRFETHEQRLNREAEERTHAESARVQAEIATWARDKPHFDRLRNMMGAMMQFAASQGAPIGLDDAYQRALRADPELYTQSQQEAEAKRAADQQAARAAAAAKARNASVSPRAGAPNSGNVPARPSKGKGIRELIVEAQAEYQGGGAV